MPAAKRQLVSLMGGVFAADKDCSESPLSIGSFFFSLL